MFNFDNMPLLLKKITDNTSVVGNAMEIDNKYFYLELVKQIRTINRTREVTITISSVTVKTAFRRKGIFKKILESLNNTGYIVYIVSVKEPYLINFLVKNNFKQDNGTNRFYK